MHRQTPPYRADMVGSLLRGARLKQARTKFAAGDLSTEALRGVEDEEIVALIARQEEIGLEA
jgi:5-methyltetrahydropteroyltriglutamate--homocysteine methyltransferase